MSIHRRFPVTIGLFSLVVLVGLLTATNNPSEHRSLMNAVGIDWAALTHFRLYAIPVATFVQSTPGVTISMMFLVALPLLALEYLVGSKRALICFLASDWLTAPITVIVLKVLANWGNKTADLMVHTPDTGSSAAAHGALAGAILQLPTRFAIACWIILVGVSVWALTFESLDAAIAHLLGIATGTIIGYYYRTHPLSEGSPSDRPLAV